MSKLQIQNLKVKVGDKLVVNGVSLTINQGEIHIIMGPNGSGKSSLINAVFSHPKYSISSGKIFLDKDEITGLSPDKKAKKGMFLSTQYLPEVSGVPLSTLIYESFKSLTGEKLSVIGFYNKLEKICAELGINPEFLKRPVNSGLSGGEKKQSEIIQLAAISPRFAFLDEIDSGVDVDSLNKVFNAIKVLKNKGTSFVLITHYPKILEKISPDFVHIMKDGEIKKTGGHEIISKIEETGFN
ncbi:MAG: Fe-S cluster assembly ATPase SufC [Patescibacteria group bacterium]